MESKESNLFLKIMGINLVRKKIFESIPCFQDISSLSQTCRKLNNIIFDDKIKKEVFCGHDVTFVEVKRNEDNRKTLGLSGLEHIKFTRYYKTLNSKINDIEQFDGERIVPFNRIRLHYKNVRINVNRAKYIPFVEKLAKEFNINSQEQKHLTTLTLSDHDFRSDTLALLHILRYLKHENINTIEIPINIFKYRTYRCDEIGVGIFDGFPNLFKLEIYYKKDVGDSYDLEKHKNIIEIIIKELSKKSNATLHLSENIVDIIFLKPYNNHHFNVFFELASKYGIKITLDFPSSISSQSNNIFSIDKSFHFSIDEFVTCYKEYIPIFNDYSNFKRNLQRFKNLKRLEVIFDNCLSAILSRKPHNSHLDNLLNTNNKMLEEVHFVIKSSTKGFKKISFESFLESIMYLASLMPNTVKILRIRNVLGLTYDVTKVLAQFMPNIEVLAFINVTFEDTNCLKAFKNLQAFVCCNELLVGIPDNVKLIAFWNIATDQENKLKNEDLLMKCSKKYSKHIVDSQGRNFFFNDAREWNFSRHIIQMIF